MRITNKMMTNNMMSNINRNKLTMSDLELQYSTGKKIQKPSDDPIITVRALKLRSNLSEIKQYYEKNIPDAMSWMDVTESALLTTVDILKQINTQCVQGSSDTLTEKDRSSIVQSLKEMKEQIYQEGNTNYAGRYVFTGYKTDIPLVFNEDTSNLKYSIIEKTTGDQIQMVSRVSGGYRLPDFDDPAVTFDESPKINNVYRIQLAYDNLDNEDITELTYTKLNAAGEEVEQTPFTNITTVSAVDGDAYNPAPGEVHFIAETGELILGEDVYEELRGAASIGISYNKSSFSKGELRPEHYFDCVMTDENKPEQEPIHFTKSTQKIEYEINFNQDLIINTEGSDAITHKVGRFIEDILNSVNEVIETENKMSEIKKRLDNPALSDSDRARYEKMKEQLETEYVLRKDVMQKLFSHGITASDKEQNRVNVALADLGSRQVRLELTENRLSSQKVDFEELMSKNEDADMVDTIIKFGSAQTIYNASLSAAARAVQTSLLDFL